MHIQKVIYNIGQFCSEDVLAWLTVCFQNGSRAPAAVYAATLRSSTAHIPHHAASRDVPLSIVCTNRILLTALDLQLRQHEQQWENHRHSWDPDPSGCCEIQPYCRRHTLFEVVFELATCDWSVLRNDNASASNSRWLWWLLIVTVAGIPSHTQWYRLRESRLTSLICWLTLTLTVKAQKSEWYWISYINLGLLLCTSRLISQ